MSVADAKKAARTAGYARRAAARTADAQAAASRHLLAALAPHQGRPVSGYMPIRTEIDPRPAMTQAARHGPVCVPMIVAKGQPLRFALWTPATAMRPGTFGAMVPKDPVFIDPEVLIVPLIAFTAHGGRLGYGGGFYDRTLQALRAARPTIAIGFAFAAQQDDGLPLEPTDQPLDAIVTEQGLIRP
ncbi:5-formyltetrahydrofolate cyclo-ligase [Oceaniglobus indicus]|uniref:5-formyltetrahydrofolate cyclo-ligase n=1 Tax=Oceaniglobus indicus TaxID=2047749 RepID=UPI000C1A3975|nr:5-formyltetrahydrofolate cyclo-ligase [Oceaniglobus indicus]